MIISITTLGVNKYNLKVTFKLEALATIVIDFQNKAHALHVYFGILKSVYIVFNVSGYHRSYNG